METVVVIVDLHRYMSLNQGLLLPSKMQDPKAKHLSPLKLQYDGKDPEKPEDIKDRIAKAATLRKSGTDPITLDQTFTGPDGQERSLRIVLLGGLGANGVNNAFVNASTTANFDLATKQLNKAVDDALMDDDCKSIISLVEWNLFFTSTNICSIAGLAARMTAHPKYAQKTNVVFCIDGNGDGTAKAQAQPTHDQLTAVELVKDKIIESHSVVSPTEEKSTATIFISKKTDSETNKDAAIRAIKDTLAAAFKKPKHTSVQDFRKTWEVLRNITSSSEPLKELTPEEKVAKKEASPPLKNRAGLKEVFTTLAIDSALSAASSTASLASTTQTLPSTANSSITTSTRSDESPLETPSPAYGTPTVAPVRTRSAEDVAIGEHKKPGTSLNVRNQTDLFKQATAAAGANSEKNSLAEGTEQPSPMPSTRGLAPTNNKNGASS